MEAIAHFHSCLLAALLAVIHFGVSECLSVTSDDAPEVTWFLCFGFYYFYFHGIWLVNGKSACAVVIKLAGGNS